VHPSSILKVCGVKRELSIMLFKKGILSFLACVVGVLGVPHRNRATASVFLLAGDSTTATQAANGGGKFHSPRVLLRRCAILAIKERIHVN